MKSVNIVQLLGNLVRNPEIRYNSHGTAFLNCTIALNKKSYDENGKLQEETSFFDFEAVGFCAEDLKISCHKGDLIWLNGRLCEVTRQTKNGKSEAKIIIRVEKFVIISSKY